MKTISELQVRRGIRVQRKEMVQAQWVPWDHWGPHWDQCREEREEQLDGDQDDRVYDPMDLDIKDTVGQVIRIRKKFKNRYPFQYDLIISLAFNLSRPFLHHCLPLLHRPPPPPHPPRKTPRWWVNLVPLDSTLNKLHHEDHRATLNSSKNNFPRWRLNSHLLNHEEFTEKKLDGSFANVFYIYK